MTITFNTQKLIDFIDKTNEEKVAVINKYKTKSQKRKRMYSVSQFARENKIHKKTLNGVIQGDKSPGPISGVSLLFLILSIFFLNSLFLFTTSEILL